MATLAGSSGPKSSCLRSTGRSRWFKGYSLQYTCGTGTARQGRNLRRTPLPLEVVWLALPPCSLFSQGTAHALPALDTPLLLCPTSHARIQKSEAAPGKLVALCCHVDRHIVLLGRNGDLHDTGCKGAACNERI